MKFRVMLGLKIFIFIGLLFLIGLFFFISNYINEKGQVEMYYNTSKLPNVYIYSEGDKGIILVHSTNKNSNEYINFTEYLAQERGYKVALVNLNRLTNPLGSRKRNNCCTKQQYLNMTRDIEEAYEELQKVGVRPENISLVGASIGATIVMEFVQKHRVNATVLLSPFVISEDINVTRRVEAYTGRLLMMASVEDQESYYSMWYLCKRSHSKDD